ncbi:hypothetical protein [Mesorhizobium captivum]|uniref:hypothetical protein n=1 Tax=Mesorhizobium captivum TaxID=3072319 RepID=UPI003D31EDDB
MIDRSAIRMSSSFWKEGREKLPFKMMHWTWNHLAEISPEAGLAPTPEESADYYRWIFFAAGPIEQPVANHRPGTRYQAARLIGVIGTEEAFSIWPSRKPHIPYRSSNDRKGRLGHASLNAGHNPQKFA